MAHTHLPGSRWVCHTIPQHAFILAEYKINYREAVLSKCSWQPEVATGVYQDIGEVAKIEEKIVVALLLNCKQKEKFL